MNTLLRSAKCCYITELASAHRRHPSGSRFWSYFRYMSSKATKSEAPTILILIILLCTFCPFLAIQDSTEYTHFTLCLQFHIFLQLMYDLIAITEDVVISMICKVDSKKATGCDKLPIRFMRLILKPWVGCSLCL